MPVVVRTEGASMRVTSEKKSQKRFSRVFPRCLNKHALKAGRPEPRPKYKKKQLFQITTHNRLFLGGFLKQMWSKLFFGASMCETTGKNESEPVFQDVSKVFKKARYEGEGGVLRALVHSAQRDIPPYSGNGVDDAWVGGWVELGEEAAGGA